nr:MAG TPA: hypothetical protein [Bacteriophage sp.]
MKVWQISLLLTNLLIKLIYLRYHILSSIPILHMQINFSTISL